MLTGERRSVSGRRGMTVLGKPAVPKPINLPSQRLENGGLDPNVEIVPRGSVSWGAAGRSPPTSSSPWGNSAQSSSPPISSGGAPPRPSTAGGNSGSATASSGPGTASSGPGTASSGGPWGGHAPRPSSAGSGTRPSSAGSLRQTQEPTAVVSAWGPATARPSSASGVLGHAQSQPPAIRPRSAETRTLSSQAPPLTRFADQTNGPAAPPPAAWGDAGAARKLGEEPHQPSRFTLTGVDFPTLGSEKNPDLRPQQNKIGSTPAERAASVDERSPPAEERPPPGPAVPYEDLPPTSTGAYGGQERMPEGWRREVRPYGGHHGMAEPTWHRDGPPPMPPFGQSPVADTWRREPGHGAAAGGGSSDDNWRRGGPPVGPYGPPGPGRFQPDPAGFMHQQRYGPGPGPYGRSAGSSGYGWHGDMYGNAAPFGRPGGVAPPRPGPPMGPGMYQGPGPYDNYYGPPGPGYGNMDDREMMMLGMSGPPGMYGNFQHGPPVESFNRFPHGGPGPGSRHLPNNTGMNRDRNESMSYEGEGYREGAKYKDNANFKDGASYKDGGGINKEGKDGGRTTSYQDSGERPGAGHVMSSSLTGEMQRPSSRGGHLGSHRDWGAAASNDEPMDFSKPVFEEDVSSVSPTQGNKQAPPVDIGTIETSGDGKPAELLKIQDSPEGVGLAVETVKGLADIGEAKDALLLQVPNSGNVSKDDHAQTRKQKEAETGGGAIPKSRIEDVSLMETKDQPPKKVPVLEGSESSEKRWGKDGRISTQTSKERSFGREHVFSPHGGRALGSKKETSTVTSSVVTPSMASAVRSGQHASGGSNSRLTTFSASHGTLSSSPAEPVVAEEAISPSGHERHAQSNSHVSNPTSPSGSDGQKINEKLRILKRVGDGDPDSPRSDTVNIIETSHAEVLVVSTPAEPLVKDDTKPKSKAINSHDGEKEWRPKAPIGDTPTEAPRPSSAGNLKQPTIGASSGASGGAIAATEKAGLLDSGSPTSVDSYDYEAQRARMKEIAAQRAIQLRKEEDERIKDQKAKAFVKLEELNRRSLVGSMSQSSEEPALDEATEEPAIMNVQETQAVFTAVVIEEIHVVENISTGVGVSTPRGARNVRNEHGKRERVGDRKSNGRSREDHRVKMASGEHREISKGRMTPSSSQGKMEPPLLPPPSLQSATSQALLPSPSTGHIPHVPQLETVAVVSVETSNSSATHVQQPNPPRLQEARHRGKQSASQLKHGARHSQASVEAEHLAQAHEAAVENADKNGGWSVGTNASVEESKEVTTSLGSGVVNTEGPTAARKKKVKNSGRNKQKPEGLTVSTDFTSSVDPNQGWNIDLSSSNDSGTEAGKPTPKAVLPIGGDDSLKAVASSISVKEVVPLDLKSEIPSGEQSAAIESFGSDVGSFRSNGDVPSKRPQRKSQPSRRVSTRERGVSQDVRVGDKPHGGEGMIWAPVRSPSGPHPAGPKGGFGSDGIAGADAAGEKKDESVATPQTGRARRAELERYTPKPVVKQQAQQQEVILQPQALPSASQHPGNESANTFAASDVVQNAASLSEIKFGSETRHVDNNSKQGRAHPSWRQRASGSERLSAPKEAHPVQHSESGDTGRKSQQPSFSNQTQQNYHRNRPLGNVPSEQSRPGSSHQTRPDQVGQQQPVTSSGEKERHLEGPHQQGRASHSNVPSSAPATIEREPKMSQESVTPYQPPRPGSGQKSRGLDGDGQSSHEHTRSHRSNTSQVDRQHGAHGKFDRDHHSSHERGQGHMPSRSHSFRHQGSSDRDIPLLHSGSHQQTRSAPSVQPSAPEGASTAREKEQKNSHTSAPIQAKSVSQSVHGQQVAPVSTDREQSHADHAGARQSPRSPGRQRTRHHTVAHERDQTSLAPHAHQQSRYRQPAQEKDHQREVPNAVHYQHQKGASDGNWQQSGGVVSEHIQPNADLSHSNENSTRSTSHKSQITTPTASVDQDHAQPTHSSSHQHSTRPDSVSKPQGSVSSDSHKQSQYQPVSQHQKPQQHSGSQGSKVDNAHNSSHWNGEQRSGSPLAVRGREHGHSRRGRFGSRYTGVGPGRGGEIENRREQLPKQRLAVDAAGGAVRSQVGG